MDKNLKIICAIIAAFFIFQAWLFRYEIVAAGTDNGTAAYRLDRWTGSVAFVHRNGMRKIVNSPPQK